MVVIDANVAVRWFVFGPGTDKAVLWRSRSDLTAPEFLLVEVANALSMYARHSALTIDQAAAIVDEVPALFSRLIPSSELAATALRLAGSHNHPVYDCLYVALAEREGAPLVTGDRRLATLAEKVGIQVERIG